MSRAKDLLTIPENVLQSLDADDDLSIAAKYVYLLLYFGYEDIDFDDPVCCVAFSELHDKGYLSYTLTK